MFFLETGQKEDEVVKRKKRKLRNAKGDNSDESSDDETEKAAIIHKNQKNKTGKTGVYDLWASNNGVLLKAAYIVKFVKRCFCVHTWYICILCVR